MKRKLSQSSILSFISPDYNNNNKNNYDNNNDENQKIKKRKIEKLINKNKVQTIIDFGQNFAPINCGKCGMLYSPGEEDSLHLSFHRKILFPKPFFLSLPPVCFLFIFYLIKKL